MFAEKIDGVDFHGAKLVVLPFAAEDEGSVADDRDSVVRSSQFEPFDSVLSFLEKIPGEKRERLTSYL